ncbi:MAG: HNH endonuclease, partial [Pseudomonadota bacterium]|nr:HNH endonuclease [Pseudomonadota bacterium]
MQGLASLEQCPALILNADYRPLSYFPLSIWSWQDAIKAIFRGSVVVVSEYDRTVSSPSQEIKL